MSSIEGEEGLGTRLAISQQTLENYGSAMPGKLWMVKCDGLILQPMACTNYKFPENDYTFYQP